MSRIKNYLKKKYHITSLSYRYLPSISFKYYKNYHRVSSIKDEAEDKKYKFLLCDNRYFLMYDKNSFLDIMLINIECFDKFSICKKDHKLDMKLSKYKEY